MRKLLYVVAVTVLTTMLYGCGNNPDKIVTSYCRALEAGKLDEAASYLSKDALQVLASIGGKSRLSVAGDKFKQHKGIKSIKITRKKVDGAKATVEFVYNFKDGVMAADYFPLVKEDGKWKITK